MRLEEKIAKILINSKKTLAIAESCTGGLLSNRLTNIPGSSNFLEFAIVAYSNESKSKLLKVPASTIRKYGAVSAPIAISMAQNVRKTLKSDFGIATTGIAGPSGGTKQKPVGLVFIAVSTDIETLCIECHFSGGRGKIKNRAATQALRLLNEFLV